MYLLLPGLWGVTALRLELIAGLTTYVYRVALEAVEDLKLRSALVTTQVIHQVEIIWQLPPCINSYTVL